MLKDKKEGNIIAHTFPINSLSVEVNNFEFRKFFVQYT